MQTSIIANGGRHRKLNPKIKSTLNYMHIMTNAEVSTWNLLLFLSEFKNSIRHC